jgi:hypothetical protein
MMALRDKTFSSSKCISVAYYDTTKRELDIIFRNGIEKTYYSVPQYVWDNFVSAYSAGRYYNQEIKGNYSTNKPDVDIPVDDDSTTSGNGKVVVSTKTVMKPVEVKTYTITLTEEEAQTLCKVIGNSSGDNGLDKIYEELLSACGQWINKA